MRIQVVFGAALAMLGAAVLAGVFPALEDYSYAIVWWGVLPLTDAWNSSRRGLSLWRGNVARFFAITIPSSVLVWLFFEALNLLSPQWRYRGSIEGVWPKVLFGFVSFSTVIPIMVESWWLVGGQQCAPAGLLRFLREHKWAFFTAAAVAMLLPAFNNVFWWNQGMWLIPAFVLLPVARMEACSASRFAKAVVISGLLAGFCWEAFNYSARTHWEYLILKSAPHLFYMPVPGYLGFIPFALSMLAVYQFQRNARTTASLAIFLYLLTFAGLYWLTVRYVEWGLWLDAPSQS